MSLNYSNQETSVTIGESVRDEDGRHREKCRTWINWTGTDAGNIAVFILQSTAPGDINDVGHSALASRIAQSNNR